MTLLRRFQFLLPLLIGAVTACGSDPVRDTEPPASTAIMVDWEHPFPPAAVTELHSIAPGNVHAVGGSGMILHYDGDAWSVVPSPTKESLNGMWGLAPDNIVAVGTGGAILRFDGREWRKESSGTTHSLNSVWGNAPDSLYAVGYSSTVLRFDGIQWSPLAPPRSEWLTDVWGSDGHNIYVGATDSLYHFDGTGWSNTGITVRENVWGIWGSSRDDVWVTDGTNWPWHYDGLKWANVYPHVNYPFTNFWGLEKDKFWGIGTDGFVSHYNGVTWSEETLGDFFFLTASGSSQNDVWVGGFAQTATAGALLHYDGNQWERSGQMLSRKVRDVWCDATGANAIAIGWAGTILQKTNETWHSVDPVTTSNINAVWGASGGGAFAVGDVGTVLELDAQGWHPRNLGTTVHLRDVWGVSMSNVYVGAADGLWHFDGHSWSPGAVMASVHSIWGTSGSNVYVAGADSLNENWMIKRFNGSAWTSVFSDPKLYVSALAGYTTGEMFATFHDNEAKQSHLKRFDGNRWTDMAAPPATNIGPLAASDNLGLIVVGYNVLDGGAVVDKAVFHLEDGEWSQVDIPYDAWFHGAWGARDAIYLVDGAAIVRLHH